MTPQNISRLPKFQDPALRRAVLISLLVSVAYYLTAIIGFEFSLQPGSVSTLWMPNSLLLAGLLLTERRWWWLVIAAACPAHFASELSSGIPTTMVLSWFVSNSVQALIGAYCITALIEGPLRFDRVRDLTIFILFGAMLAPFLSSFLDTALIKVNGWGSDPYWYLWRIRFLANVLASLTLIPVITVWVYGGLAAVRKAPSSRYLEAVVMFVGLFIVSFYVFDSPQSQAENTPSLLYWPLPFLLWATVRFGPRGASTSLLLVMFMAIEGAARGTGPFLTSSSADNAVSIQWFLIVVSIPMMILAAVFEERRRAEASARQNEERLTLALNSAQMGTWEWLVAENRLVYSETTKQLLGIDANVTATTIEEAYQNVHPDDLPTVQRAVSCAISDGTPYEIEFRYVRYGESRWFLAKGNVIYDDAGKVLKLVGICLDLTERKQAQEVLAEINERNRAMLAAIPDMMFLHSSDGVYLDYYARDSGLLLMPPEQFLGKKVGDVLPPDLAEKLMDSMGRLNGDDQPQVFEYKLTIDGEERQYEARLVSAGGGKSLSIVRDVTEARRAVEAVRRGEERLMQGHRQIRALAAKLLTAQESERRRISLMLHDDVSQNVAAIGLSISRLKRKLPTTSDEIVAELDRLGSQVNDLTTQIRHLSHQLHPAVLEHLGLVAALESHVTDFSNSEKIEINFVADVGTDPIPLDLSVCLYRVALEALRNVSRHSGASYATVSLKEVDGCLMLEVSDSGKGFDVERARRGSGIGLLSTEERIKLLNGSLEIRSGPQTGTVLAARVPLPR